MRRLILCTALIVGSCVTILPIESLLVSRHAALVDTPSGTGSAFPISDDAYLTAWHVVEGEDAEDITVDGWGVSEVLRLAGLDAALLFTGIHGLQPWPLGNRGPRPGQPLWKSGYGQGFHWWTAGFGTEDSNRVSLDIWSGDSGGPVFDARGEVLGIIVSMGMTREGDAVSHHAWIVTIDRILSALPEDLFWQDPVEMPLPPNEPWEEFLRLRKERLGF